MQPPRRMNRPAWNAFFKLDLDISGLFPYINAIVDDALYFERPHYIRFIMEETGCILYPQRAITGLFPDREEALAFAWKVIDFLNSLDARKGEISPNHRKFKHISVLDIFKILPRTNCKKCGYPTCMAFAAAISAHEAVPGQCPDFSQPITTTTTYPVFDKQGHLVSTVEIETTGQEPDPLTPPVPPEKDAPAPTPFGEILTTREIEVLRLLAEGFTNGEISGMLTISPHTVKSHVIHIFNKLGVNDRTQAAVWAAKNNLV
ncbi:MAG: hypothetical protein JEZ02_11595 [Desulfatibacillum sp.]|nr:hypothetical protein [Desulfatibacillum sp.]